MEFLVILKIIKVEPYWNVKIFAEAIEELKDLIKVEPYWNVKRYRIEPKLFGSFD